MEAVTADPHAQLILIIGGARSGKSRCAERLARQSGRSVAFLATATASDEDMRDRIARHQATRPTSWYTIEEPLQLADALQRAAGMADVILLDCMTLWVGNWLIAQQERDFAKAEMVSGSDGTQLLQELEIFLEAVSKLDTGKTVLVVTNEVGLGIVPPYALGRIYRDVLGLVNQRLAVAAQRVYLMIAGLAVDIKRLHDDAAI
jgi:adenosylcobinamide kinase/adenosylcobinamide-phosphate guanylyltransferase